MADLISLELLLEQVKTELYKEIIQKNTVIQLPVETSTTNIKNKIINIVHLFNSVSSEQLTIIENDFIIEDDDDDDTSNNNQLKSLKIIQLYNPQLKSISTQELDILKNKFNTFIDTIINSRIFKKHLENLKTLKNQLYSKFNYKQYINLLENHINVFKSICQQKECFSNKLEEFVLNSSTQLDLRLLTYNTNYRFNSCIKQIQNSYLSVDENDSLNEMLGFEKITDENEIQPIDYNVFIPFVLNYTSATKTFRTICERIITHGNNIVYFRHNFIDSIEDSYSFYYLQKIDSGKRYWYMDCRLEELTTIFINNLLPYLTKMFRLMYHDCFHDNIYRKNFFQINSFFENDVQQLFNNICILSNYCRTCDILRDIIYNRCHYIKKENDEFNIISDDSLQKKMFDKKRASLDHFDKIKILFDDITDQDIEEIYI